MTEERQREAFDEVKQKHGPIANGFTQETWFGLGYRAGEAAGLERALGELPMLWTESDDLKFATVFRNMNSIEWGSRPDMAYRVGWNDALKRATENIRALAPPAEEKVK